MLMDYLRGRKWLKCLFVLWWQPVQKSTETKEQKQKSPQVKGQPRQEKKQQPAKEKSAANQELEKRWVLISFSPVFSWFKSLLKPVCLKCSFEFAGFRESGLQKADEDEDGPEKPNRKRKRQTSESGRENDTEYWVMKRQRLKASKAQETLKKKRTVFVGNLPISCTKKVYLVSLFYPPVSIVTAWLYLTLAVCIHKLHGRNMQCSLVLRCRLTQYWSFSLVSVSLRVSFSSQAPLLPLWATSLFLLMWRMEKTRQSRVCFKWPSFSHVGAVTGANMVMSQMAL